jgi:hypothetical protein
LLWIADAIAGSAFQAQVRGDVEYVARLSQTQLHISEV